MNALPKTTEDLNKIINDLTVENTRLATKCWQYALRLDDLAYQLRTKLDWYDEWTQKEIEGEVDSSYVYDMARDVCQDVYFGEILSVLSAHRRSNES